MCVPCKTGYDCGVFLCENESSVSVSVSEVCLSMCCKYVCERLGEFVLVSIRASVDLVETHMNVVFESLPEVNHQQNQLESKTPKTT